MKLDARCPLLVLQGLLASGSNFRSPHSHSPHTRSLHSHTLQKLKDDLLDDTVWPVVMQWFNEDHPLNRSSFKNTALTTGHDIISF